MKVALCSSQMFVGHRLLGDKLQSCIISIGGRGFRPSRLSPYRQSVNTWGSISNLMRTISRRLMSQSFCTISCNTSAVISSYCGTGLLSIREKLSVTFLAGILVFMWNGSPDMPLSSIQWSLYGHRRSADWPIVPLRERRSLSEC